MATSIDVRHGSILWGAAVRRVGRLIGCLAIGCQLSGVVRAEVIDRVLAVVSREVITLSDVTAAVRLGFVTPAAGQDPIRIGLDALIVRQLQLTEAIRYQPPEPAAAQVAERLGAVQARFPAGDGLRRTLAQSGWTEEQLRLHVRDDLRIEAYLAQRFGSMRQPSDAELMEYYRAHEAEFAGPGGTRPFADVRNDVQARVVAAQRASQMADWLEGLRRRTEVSDLYAVGK